MIFNVTAEDFLKGTILNPGWYPCIIVGVSDTTSEKKGTAGVEITFKVVAPEQFKGVPLTVSFWESAPGMVLPLLDAVAGKPIPRTPGALKVNEEALKGKTVDVEVKRGEWNNRAKNDVVNFKPYSGPALNAAPKPAGV